MQYPYLIDQVPKFVDGYLIFNCSTLHTADDELDVRTLVSFHGKANAQYILDITPLNEVC